MTQSTFGLITTGAVCFISSETSSLMVVYGNVRGRTGVENQNLNRNPVKFIQDWMEYLFILVQGVS